MPNQLILVGLFCLSSPTPSPVEGDYNQSDRFGYPLIQAIIFYVPIVSRAILYRNMRFICSLWSL